MDAAAMKLFLEQQQKVQQEQAQQQMEFFRRQQEQLLQTLQAAFAARTADPPSIINSLSGRIPSFSYAPEDGETFDNWFGRYEDIIESDGAQLDDAARTRFILSKLERKEAEMFRNTILPKLPADLEFDEAVVVLKKLFNQTKSLTRLRFELLTTTFDGVDRKEYTGLVKRRFTAAKWNLMTDDQMQCLLWIIGYQSSEFLEFRHRALRELELDPKITLDQLTDRLEQVLSFKTDAEFIGGTGVKVRAVNAGQGRSKVRKTSTSPPPQSAARRTTRSSCFRCGQAHVVRDCKVPRSIVCHKCNKQGHLQKVCQEEEEDAYRSNAVFIARASAGTRNCIVKEVDINGEPISMQLDTGAEVTLLSRKDWILLGRPKLSPSKLNLRSAANGVIDVLGHFHCGFVLDGHIGSGTCHVTDTQSLLGMDWIVQDKTLYSQLCSGQVSAVAEVKSAARTSRRRKTKKREFASQPSVQMAQERRGGASADGQVKSDVVSTCRNGRSTSRARVEKAGQLHDRMITVGAQAVGSVAVVRREDGSSRVVSDASNNKKPTLLLSEKECVRPGKASTCLELEGDRCDRCSMRSHSDRLSTHLLPLSPSSLDRRMLGQSLSPMDRRMLVQSLSPKDLREPRQSLSLPPPSDRRLLLQPLPLLSMDRSVQSSTSSLVGSCGSRASVDRMPSFDASPQSTTRGRRSCASRGRSPGLEPVGSLIDVSIEQLIEGDVTSSDV